MLETDLDYRVAAIITDDVGLKGAPLLYWQRQAPANPSDPDLTTFETVQLRSASASIS